MRTLFFFIFLSPLFFLPQRKDLKCQYMYVKEHVIEKHREVTFIDATAWHRANDCLDGRGNGLGQFTLCRVTYI